MASVTAAQMKEIERAADAAGLSYRQMMENAGRCVFAAARQRFPQARTAAVFAGKGNNGGDGFVAAQLLAQAGVRVRVVLVEGEPVTPDAAHYFARMTGAEVLSIEAPDARQQAELAASDIVIDALYGTGFHGALHENGRRAAALMNRAAGRVIACDLPSGVNADTGAVAEGAVRAALTITFHARKVGQDVPAAAAQCGEITVADIGIRL